MFKIDDFTFTDKSVYYHGSADLFMPNHDSGFLTKYDIAVLLSRIDKFRGMRWILIYSEFRKSSLIKFLKCFLNDAVVKDALASS